MLFIAQKDFKYSLWLNGPFAFVRGVIGWIIRVGKCEDVTKSQRCAFSHLLFNKRPEVWGVTNCHVYLDCFKTNLTSVKLKLILHCNVLKTPQLELWHNVRIGLYQQKLQNFSQNSIISWDIWDYWVSTWSVKSVKCEILTGLPWNKDNQEKCMFFW